MIEDAIIQVTEHSSAIAIVILAGALRQLSVKIEDIKESLKDVKDGCVWQDEFQQFEENYRVLEGRVNQKFNGKS